MQGTLINYKNTGSNDPFNARLIFGVLDLRSSIVKDEQERMEFDNLYAPIMQNLDEAFTSKKDLMDLIAEHRRKLASGEIVNFQAHALEITESIDRKMGELFNNFFIKGQIALKLLQKLTKKYDLKIGHFFKDDEDFAKGNKKLLESGDERIKAFAEMLASDRNWHKVFSEVRRRIEHEGFSLGAARYKTNEKEVALLLPTFDNEKFEHFLDILEKNLFEFVEDVIATMVQLKLPGPLTVVKIPKEQQDPSLPVKYKVYPKDLAVK